MEISVDEMKGFIIQGMKLKEVEKLLMEALLCEGAHHKEWYLEEVAKEVGVLQELEKRGYERTGITP